MQVPLTPPEAERSAAPRRHAPPRRRGRRAAHARDRAWSRPSTSSRPSSTTRGGSGASPRPTRSRTSTRWARGPSARSTSWPSPRASCRSRSWPRSCRAASTRWPKPARCCSAVTRSRTRALKFGMAVTGTVRPGAQVTNGGAPSRRPALPHQAARHRQPHGPPRARTRPDPAHLQAACGVDGAPQPRGLRRPARRRRARRDRRHRLRHARPRLRDGGRLRRRALALRRRAAAARRAPATSWRAASPRAARPAPSPHLGPRLAVDADVDPVLQRLAADSETSGGLLIAIEPAREAALQDALVRSGVLVVAVGEVSRGGDRRAHPAECLDAPARRGEGRGRGADSPPRRVEGLVTRKNRRLICAAPPLWTRGDGCPEVESPRGAAAGRWLGTRDGLRYAGGRSSRARDVSCSGVRVQRQTGAASRRRR